MASENTDDISTRYSMLQSLSTSDLEDSLAQNICCTQAMWAQIAHAMSRLEEEPIQWAELINHAAQLKEQDWQLAKSMELGMTCREQVSVLSWMNLQQAEEVKAQNQEIHHLSALVEKQQEAIQKLSSPCRPPGKQEQPHHVQNPN